jgi:hypothetical protein
MSGELAQYSHVLDQKGSQLRRWVEKVQPNSAFIVLYRSGIKADVRLPMETDLTSGHMCLLHSKYLRRADQTFHKVVRRPSDTYGSQVDIDARFYR